MFHVLDRFNDFGTSVVEDFVKRVEVWLEHSIIFVPETFFGILFILLFVLKILDELVDLVIDGSGIEGECNAEKIEGFFIEFIGIFVLIGSRSKKIKEST